MSEFLVKTENTTVGPAGSNSSALPVTGHETHGHLDDNKDGGMSSGSVGGGIAGPTASGEGFSGTGGGAPGDDFSWSGTGPLKPINT